MVEREMQELIWKYPERFFNEPLKQFAWEASSEVGRADLVFEDRHGRLLIIEVKRGKLPRGAIDQLHDYFGMMKQKYPKRAVEMMVVAWAIPSERRLACEHYDIECKEFSEKFFREIAAECGYLFASESQISGKNSEGAALGNSMEPTGSTTVATDNAGFRVNSEVQNEAKIPGKLAEQNILQTVVASPIPWEAGTAARNTLPDSGTLLLPVLQAFADGVEHTSEEIRDLMKVKFKIAPNELLAKHTDRIPVFHNNVALALANLQGAPHRGSKCIEKVGQKRYRITEYGRSLLNRNPIFLSIKDL